MKEPAYPSKGGLHKGLTKREYFAGLALQACICGNVALSDGLDCGSIQPGAEEAAKEAVAYADALLAELKLDNNGG